MPFVKQITDEQRFLSHVDRSGGADACWPWLGARDRKGYGFFKLTHHRQVRAHRWAYERWCEPIPDGGLVCHSCDNPPCVNPAHLWVGTNQANADDKIAKGRARYVEPFNRACGERVGSRRYPERLARGEAVASAKLTEDAVRAIRIRRADGATVTALADDFGVSPAHISRIVRRRNWSHID